MRGLITVAMLALSLIGCHHPQPLRADTLVCALPQRPTVLEESGSPHSTDAKLLQRWDAPNASVLWTDATPTEPAFSVYLEELQKSGVDPDPLAALAASPTFNNELVLRHARDWVHPAGCLEKLMTSVQHARMDMVKSPTEFAAVVLRSADSRQLRIYYYTINQGAIGRASPITEPALADVRAGWRLAIILHNHAFYPGNSELNGIVAPSIPDADLHLNLAASGLEEAWITNGVATVRIPAAAFAQFQAN